VERDEGDFIIVHLEGAVVTRPAVTASALVVAENRRPRGVDGIDDAIV
jgi:hypothetical protein